MKHRGYSARRRAVRRKRTAAGAVLSFIAAAVCLGCIGALGYGLYRFVGEDECFHVRTIHIEGACVVSPETIIAQSGVTTDDIILFMDVAAIGARVEALPYVKTCRVKRIFPDKVSIEVDERVALATLLVNNRPYMVDNDGVVVREPRPGEPHTGPYITNVPGLSGVDVGERLAHPELIQALAVWHAFSQTGTARQVTVSEISAEKSSPLCMYCDELDFEIRWRRGNIEKQALKLDLFWHARGDWSGCKEYLDLRYGNDVAYQQ